MISRLYNKPDKLEQEYGKLEDRILKGMQIREEVMKTPTPLGTYESYQVWLRVITVETDDGLDVRIEIMRRRTPGSKIEHLRQYPIFIYKNSATVDEENALLKREVLKDMSHYRQGEV